MNKYEFLSNYYNNVQWHKKKHIKYTGKFGRVIKTIKENQLEIPEVEIFNIKKSSLSVFSKLEMIEER